MQLPFSEFKKQFKHFAPKLKRRNEKRKGFKLVSAFADMRHSGASATIAILQLEKLLRFENLSSLTNDKDGWTDVSNISGSPTWQNKRNPSALSFDEGKSYFFVSNSSVIYTSAPARDRPRPSSAQTP